MSNFTEKHNGYNFEQFGRGYGSIVLATAPTGERGAFARVSGNGQSQNQVHGDTGPTAYNQMIAKMQAGGYITASGQNVWKWKINHLVQTSVICQQYMPQYPNQRDGPCKYSNTYGPHGCDCERTEFCQAGPQNLEACTCARCAGTCAEKCELWDERIGCRHQNSYGQHGCPMCKD